MQRAERLRLYLENVKFLCGQHGLDIEVAVCALRGADGDLAKVEGLRGAFGGAANGDVVRLLGNGGDAEGRFSLGVTLRDAEKFRSSSV